MSAAEKHRPIERGATCAVGRARLWLAVLVFGLAISAAVAQQEPPESRLKSARLKPPEEDADAAQEEYLRPALVLHEDVVAGLDVQRARQLAESGRTPAAVKLLQSVVDRFPAKVIRRGNLYLPVTQVVRQEVARLGERGIRIYRLLYDANAERLLREWRAERDPRVLRRLVRRYYWSSHTPEALWTLIRLDVEQKRFADALAWIERLRHYPEAPYDPADIAALEIYCLAGSGLPRRAHRIAQRLAEKRIRHARFGDRRVDLREFAAGLAPPVEKREGLSWPDPSHARPMPPARLDRHISVELADVRARTRPEHDWRHGLPVSLSIPAYGLAVDGDRAMLTLGGGHWVADATTGRVLWGRYEQAKPSRAGAHAQRTFSDMMPLGTWQNRARVCFSYPCIRAGRVFFVPETYPNLSLDLPQGRPAALDAALDMLANRLVCADATTGEVLWEVAYEKPTRFLASPVYWRGRLFVPLLAERELKLVCIDAEDGSVIALTSLAALPEVDRLHLPELVFDLLMFQTPPVAVGDERVAVATGTGAVFICSAVTGRLQWIYGYPRDVWEIDEEVALLNFPSFLYGLGMIPGPPVISEGRLLIAPSDSEAIFALDLRTRSRIWKRPRGKDNYLAGLSGGRLILQGQTVRALSADTGEELWALEKCPALVGRCAVTADRLYAPTVEGVLRLDAATGRIDGRFDYGPDIAAPTGVNVFALPERLAMLARRHVRLLMDAESVLAEARRLEKDPKSRWRAHLLRGRVLAAHGKSREAEAELKRALTLARERENRSAVAAVSATLFDHYLETAQARPDLAVLEQAAPIAEADPARQARLHIARIDVARRARNADAFLVGLEAAAAELARRAAAAEPLDADFLFRLNEQIDQPECDAPELIATLVTRVEKAKPDAPVIDHFSRFVDLPAVQIATTLKQTAAAPEDRLAALRRALLLWPAAADSPVWRQFTALCEQLDRRALLRGTAREILLWSRASALSQQTRETLRKVAGTHAPGPALDWRSTDKWEELWSLNERPVATGVAVGRLLPDHALSITAREDEPLRLALAELTDGTIAARAELPSSDAVLEDKDLQGRLNFLFTGWQPIAGTAGDRLVLITPFGVSGWEPLRDAGRLTGLRPCWHDTHILRRKGISVTDMVTLGRRPWAADALWAWRLLPGDSLRLRDAWRGTLLLEDEAAARPPFQALPLSAGRWLLYPRGNTHIILHDILRRTRLQWELEVGQISGQPVRDKLGRVWIPTDGRLLSLDTSPLTRRRPITLSGVAESILYADEASVIVRLFNGRVEVVDPRTGQKLWDLMYQSADGDMAVDALRVGDRLFVLEIRGAQAVASWRMTGGVVDWQSIKLRSFALDSGKLLSDDKISGVGYGLVGRLRHEHGAVFALLHQRPSGGRNYQWVIHARDAATSRLMMEQRLFAGMWAFPIGYFEPFFRVEPDRILIGTSRHGIVCLQRKPEAAEK